MKKDRTITISTKHKESYIVTRVHFDMGTIYVSKDGRYIFNGEIIDFKKRIQAEQNPDLKQVYADILDLGEEVIEIMSKA